MLRSIVLGLILMSSGAGAQTGDSFLERVEPNPEAPRDRGRIGPVRAEQDCPAPGLAPLAPTQFANTIEFGFGLETGGGREKGIKPYARYTCPQAPHRTN